MEKKLCHIFLVVTFSVTFGNLALLQCFAGTTNFLMEIGFLTDKKKTYLIREAVKSDSPPVVGFIKSMLLMVSVDNETIKLAHSRGNRKIIEIVDSNFETTDQLTEKLKVKAMMIQKLEAGESSLDLLPSNKDFEYVNKIKMISDLLPADRNSTIVNFEDLLKFHVPPVHIDQDELILLECRKACSQSEYCGNIRKAIRIAEFIKKQLGFKDDLFKLIKKPMVLGSMRENTKLFNLGSFLKIF